jgi:hypothetical protein
MQIILEKAEYDNLLATHTDWQKAALNKLASLEALVLDNLTQAKADQDVIAMVKKTFDNN